MPQYKLTYFNWKAIAESIRLMLSYMGKEFEDCRVERQVWPKNNDKTPFGKLPILEVDGKVLCQTVAILRYLANEAGLVGDNIEENLEIDMIVGAYGDLIAEIVRMVRTETPSEKEEIKKSIINGTIPFLMGRFETILTNNGGYLANGKLSWADLYVAGHSSSLPGSVGINLTEKYPFFKEYIDRIHSLPGIKEWVQKRPITSL